MVRDDICLSVYGQPKLKKEKERRMADGQSYVLWSCGVRTALPRKSSSSVQSGRRYFCSRPTMPNHAAETVLGGESTSSRIRALLLPGTGLPRSFGRNRQDTQKHLCAPACLFGFPDFSLKSGPFILAPTGFLCPPKRGWSPVTCAPHRSALGAPQGNTALLSGYCRAPKATAPRAEAFLHSPSARALSGQLMMEACSPHSCRAPEIDIGLLIEAWRERVTS